MPDFIPRSDSACLAWSAGYVEGVAADPGRFRIPPEDAAALVATQAAFERALATAGSPDTRTPVAVVEKNIARRAMEAVVRRTANVVRGVLVNDRATLVGLGLGLAVGRGRHASRPRVGRPTTMPAVHVGQVQGSAVSILLHNTDAPAERGLARGIAGATLFSYVGDEPPASIRDWRMHGNTSRIDTTVKFDSSRPPGTKVWVCAQWTNRRGEAGPPSAAVYTYLGYSLMPRNGGGVAA